MITILENVLKDAFQAIYEPFGFALILAVLFMFLYLYAGEHGWKQAFADLAITFRTNVKFRKVFFLVFYTALILFRTLLNRTLWLNPLVNVLGGWEVAENDTQAIENVVLFIPFTLLLFSAYPPKKNAFLSSLKISFLFSFGIEFSQLLFHLGTLQLSDLCYNTLGGVIGGILYCTVVLFKKK